MITVEDVNQRVAAMGELVESREWVAAAKYERVLWEDVMEAIHDGQWNTNSQDLAGAALATRQYQFPRFGAPRPAVKW